MNIIERIQEKLPELTRKQREIAEYMLEDIDRMSYVTLKEMSNELSITEMTILKTCNILGFSSFTDMKYEFRKLAARQMEAFRHPNVEYTAPKTPAYELDDTHKLLLEISQEQAQMTAIFYNNLNIAQVFQAADMMRSADKIVLCGRGVSYYVCEYMSALLSVVGLASIVINTELDDEIHRTLPMLDDKTLLFAIAFPDYYRMTFKMAEYAHGRKIPVLLMTDSEKSPMVPFADLSLYVPSKDRMYLNSIGNPMAMVNLLAAALNILLSASVGEEDDAKHQFYALFKPEMEAYDN